MGKMNEPLGGIKQEAFKAPDFSVERFNALADCSSGRTEVEVDPGLSILRLYAGVFEGNTPTNRIINIDKPWDVRVSWQVDGPLRELICGTWCCDVVFESIGPGREFKLEGAELDFNCKHKCYSVCIPGRGIDPDDCGTPYKAVVVLRYKSMCGHPGSIGGFVELPMLEFYKSEY